MSDSSRIEKLRRRVDTDPASIALAQLAEEYRRAGSYAEAVDACRSCLAVHPGYLSARVTLGRALIEIDELDEAAPELNRVLEAAPENLAALRGLAQIHHRRGNLSEALRLYRAALALSRHDSSLERAIDDISHTVTTQPEDVAEDFPLEDTVADADWAIFQQGPPGPAELPAGAELPARAELPAMAEPPALPHLERFLGAIQTYRQRQAV